MLCTQDHDLLAFLLQAFRILPNTCDKHLRTYPLLRVSMCQTQYGGHTRRTRDCILRKRGDTLIAMDPLPGPQHRHLYIPDTNQRMTSTLYRHVVHRVVGKSKAQDAPLCLVAS